MCMKILHNGTTVGRIGMMQAQLSHMQLDAAQGPKQRFSQATGTWEPELWAQC